MESSRLIVRVLVAGVIALAGLQWGCSGGFASRYERSGNPLLDIRNPDLLDRDRVAAAREAWAEVESGVRNRDRTREAFKSLAWSSATGEPLRLELVNLLMSDRTEEGSADSLRMARLMLPTERSPAVVRVLARAAVERGWAGALPALVRSYARPSPNVPDADRAERWAIEQLVPGLSAEEAVYAVFLRPGGTPGGGVEDAVLRTEERTRDDAWTLLSRLDTSGRARARLIGEPAPSDADPGSVSDMETLRAGLRDLGVLPRTGDELAWLRRLHSHPDKDRAAANAAWWSEATGAVGSLSDPQREGLELRHVEAVRWAATNRPAWLGASREALLVELADRLGDRDHQTRDAPRGQRSRSEKLRDWAERLSWGDVLTTLVVDEAVRGPGVAGDFFDQTGLDRRDTTTEYGGVLEADGQGGMRAVLFRPRARDRIDDDRFVASSDMVVFSDRGLAHYHLQVQDKRLSDEAGPSLGDLMYAAGSGRTCLVLTSIGTDRLNLDLYTPDGEVLDLGMIQRP